SENPGEVAAAPLAGGFRGLDLRSYRRRPHLRGRQGSRRQLQLPHPRRAARRTGFRILLAPPPLLPGQHSSHQGSRTMVQVQLHAQDERQKTIRNPREPAANEAPPRTLQAVADSDSTSMGRRSPKRESLDLAGVGVAIANADQPKNQQDQWKDGE